MIPQGVKVGVRAVTNGVLAYKEPNKLQWEDFPTKDGEVIKWDNNVQIGLSTGEQQTLFNITWIEVEHTMYFKFRTFAPDKPFVSLTDRGSLWFKKTGKSWFKSTEVGTYANDVANANNPEEPAKYVPEDDLNNNGVPDWLEKVIDEPVTTNSSAKSKGFFASMFPNMVDTENNGTSSYRPIIVIGSLMAVVIAFAIWISRRNKKAAKAQKPKLYINGKPIR